MIKPNYSIINICTFACVYLAYLECTFKLGRRDYVGTQFKKIRQFIQCCLFHKIKKTKGKLNSDVIFIISRLYCNITFCYWIKNPFVMYPLRNPLIFLYAFKACGWYKHKYFILFMWYLKFLWESFHPTSLVL